MSRFTQLFILASFAVATAADKGAADLQAAMFELQDLQKAHTAGWKDLVEAAEAWGPREEGNSREKANKIIKGITEAADAKHEMFSGVRIFATSLQKAVDSGDEAALTKALAAKMRNNFLKALARISKKVEAQVANMKASKKAEEEAAASGKAFAYQGMCRYGDDEKDLAMSEDQPHVAACEQACRASPEPPCTAYSFAGKTCNLYRGGPYTKGNGNPETKCYNLQAKDVHEMPIEDDPDFDDDAPSPSGGAGSKKKAEL